MVVRVEINMGIRDIAQTGLRKSILKYLGAGAESTDVEESDGGTVRSRGDFSDRHVESEGSSRLCR